jgi:hypothetical protein
LADGDEGIEQFTDGGFWCAGEVCRHSVDGCGTDRCGITSSASMGPYRLPRSWYFLKFAAWSKISL